MLEPEFLRAFLLSGHFVEHGFDAFEPISSFAVLCVKAFVAPECQSTRLQEGESRIGIILVIGQFGLERYPISVRVVASQVFCESLCYSTSAGGLVSRRDFVP
jgi:hypothetical protein